jgi:hypothetical protein
LQAQLTNDGRFDFTTAGAMAWLSQLAYETSRPRKVGEVLERWGLSLRATVKTLTSGIILPLADTRGLVLEGWGGTIVVFAGTDPLLLANWLTDFNTRLGADDVHTGFENGVKAVWQEVRSAVLAHNVSPGLLYLAGHSLGGALAVIAAKFFTEDRPADVGAVYTFGMPRCGGQHFVEAYGSELGSRTYRFVHGDDIVPTVPPEGLGFRHVGCQLSCQHGESFDPSLRPVPSQRDEPALLATVLQGIRNQLHAAVTFDSSAPTQPGRLGQGYRFLPPGIGDHLPSRYLTALGFSPEKDGS